MANNNLFSTEIRFRYEGGAHDRRVYPSRIEWRQLPYTLIEIPTGGNWVLEVEGSPPVTVYSGEALVISRGVRHRFHMAGATEMHTTFAFVLFDAPGGADILAPAQIPCVLPRATGEKLVVLMNILRGLEEGISRGDRLALAQQYRAGFDLLSVLLSHAVARQAPPVNPDRERLLPALQYVEANLGKPLSIPDLARRVSLSPSRFHFVFKRVLGLAPVAYVQQARLRQAQHLLLTTPDTVASVATRSGFVSSYYFCRVFRRQFNTTPTTFRKELRRMRLTT